MSKLIQTITIIILLILGSTTVIWLFLFQPIFKLSEQLSITIREEIAQDIQTSHNSLTTLAATAIVLTFSILQIFSQTPIQNIPLIVATWIGFLVTVLLGTAIGIVTYVERIVSKVLVKKMSMIGNKKEMEEEISADDRQVIKYAIPKMIQLRQIRFWLLYGQSVAFVAGTIFLTVFAIANIVTRT